MATWCRPRSIAELVAAFRSDPRALIVGGGSVLVPAHTANPASPLPETVLMLDGAGLDEITDNGGTVRMGAATTLAAVVEHDSPLSGPAAAIGDREIRAQATLAGNLCTPSGDLQGPLLALAAVVEVIDPAGDHGTVTLDRFLENPVGLVIAVRYNRAPAFGFADLRRPHSNAFGTMSVSYARTDLGERYATTGLTGAAREFGWAEGQSAPKLPFRDDALASARYRARMLPVLVDRARRSAA